MSSVCHDRTGAVRRLIAAGPRRAALIVAVLWAGVATTSAPDAVASEVHRSDWTLEKCQRYRDAAREALQRFGSDGLSDGFLSRHQAFLDRDCADPRDVCPVSPQDLAFADRMIIRAMNAGMASTFPPFACKG